MSAIRLWSPMALLGLILAAACTSKGPPNEPAGSDGGTALDSGLPTASCDQGWCTIPAGEFTMGSPEGEFGHPAQSENQVQVTLTRSFLLMQHEVTQADWLAAGFQNPSTVAEDGSYGDGDDPGAPVGNVNWFEALSYANRMSELHSPSLAPCYVLDGCTGIVGGGDPQKLDEGQACTGVSLAAATVYDCDGFRLPTQAEWEYATRAGTTTAFYGGDISPSADLSDCSQDSNLLSIAWYCANSQARTHPVGQKQPNAYGLFDTLGNALEWVHDPYRAGGYGTEPLVDPFGGMFDLQAPGLTRGCSVVGWPTICRAASHMSGSREKRGPTGGFRLARTLSP